MPHFTDNERALPPKNPLVSAMPKRSPVKLGRYLMKCLKQLGPEDCDRILETLAVGSVVASLWTCSGLLGVLSAPLATYCLITKHRRK